MAEVADLGTDTIPKWDQLAGRTIAGKYYLEEHIGSGSSGTVYRARHSVLEKPVALKILDPDLALSAEMVELFKHEAKAASRLDHPNSVRILDFGSDSEGLLYIVMEFVQGPDLLQFLDERFPLEHARVVDIMSQILGALAQAHELGVIHRDLKPENVLVLRGRGDDGQATEIVKVCDFGVAQLSPVAVPAVPLPRTDHAHPTVIDANMLVGTPEYMSPEQARGEPLDPRSDVYAAGVVLFQLLTRRLPFEGETAGDIATLQCYGPVPRPAKFAYVPALLEAICLKALSKDPVERYQSAREMRGALQQFAQLQRTKTLPGGLQRRPAANGQYSQYPDTMSPPPASPVEEDSERPRRSTPAVATSALLASAVVIAAYLAMRDPSPVEAPSTASAAAPRAAAPSAAPAFDSLASSVLKPPANTPGSAEVAGLPTGRQLAAQPRRATGERRSRRDPVAPSAASAAAAAETSTAPPPSGLTAGDALEASLGGEPEDSIDEIALGALPERDTASALEEDAEGAASAPEPLKPQPARAEPLKANVRVADLSVRGSVATSVVERAIDRARSRFSACYRHSAEAAGRNGYGGVRVEVELDEYGRARRSRADGSALPGLDRCITEVTSKLVTASAPDTGTVKATFRLAFTR